MDGCAITGRLENPQNSIDFAGKFVIETTRFSMEVRPSFRSSQMDEETKQIIKNLGFLSTMGLAMALSIALGALIGYYLDDRFGTDPWCLYVGLALGIAAAFRNLYILYKKAKDMF